MWMVRAGEKGYLFNDFKNKGIVAIGWYKLGNPSRAVDSSEIRSLVKRAYPDEKDGYISLTAGQVSRFIFDFRKGHEVITYSPESRTYLVGEILSDYQYDTTLIERHANIRKVKWLGEIPRDKLSIQTKNALGSLTTVFEVAEEAAGEIKNVLENKAGAQEKPPEEQLDELKQDIRNKASEFIKDRILELSWEDSQVLVAGILDAMGYRTKVLPKGPDRGRDIEASRDGLGLEDPRIVVQVKHREGSMGAHQIRSFIAILRPGQKGLYVSTGGFSKDARLEAERSNISLTLVDLDDLVDLIVQYYDNFDSETRTLLPLTKIYWPE